MTVRLDPRSDRRAGRALVGLVARVGLVCLLALLVVAPTPLTVTTPAAAAPYSAVFASRQVSMSVTDVFPNTPPVTADPSPLRFTLTVVNHGTTIPDFAVTTDRSDPIASQGAQEALNNAIMSPQPPSQDLVSPVRSAMYERALPVGTTTITLTTFTSDKFDVAAQHGGICLCLDAIYPIWFTASGTSSTSEDVETLATAQTYLPSFTAAPVASTVSWVWPLLERPHRLTRERVFLDDDLASSVRTGGRLDQLLQVVTDVAPTVPLTVLTDPDLIDELTTMSSGYRVANADGSTRRGTGGPDAQRWLDTFRAVLAAHPRVELAFTPDADPAVDSLTRHGRGWADVSPAEVTSAALERTALTDIAWPIGEVVGRGTLQALIRRGAHMVVLADRTLSAPVTHPAPSALVPLRSAAGDALAAVTSTPIERLVRSALDTVGPGLEALPRLVAQLAVPVVENSKAARHVVLTPPRDLETSPGLAVRLIEATARTPWSRPVPLHAAARTVPSVDQGALRPGLLAPQLPGRVLDRLTYVERAVPSLRDMYSDPVLGSLLYADYPSAVQRCESSSLVSDPSRAGAMAGSLVGAVTRTSDRVSIVQPSEDYTLTSKSSELPVTVVNRLNATVDFKISVTAQDAFTGFSAGKQDHVFEIGPNTKVQEHIPTHVDNVAVIKLDVGLTTPDGAHHLGRLVHVKVRSTVIGTIGVVITVVAAIVLALAVLVRFARRLRRRPATDPTTESTPVGAGASAPS